MRGRHGKATPVEWDVPLAPEADYIPMGVFLSRIPDPEYPWPVQDIKRIREFDPGMIPILRKKVYRARSGGIHVFRHHGICRFDPHTNSPDPLVIHAPVPGSGYFSTLGPANIIDLWFEDPDHVRPGTKRFLNNLPPPYIPWTEEVTAWIRACHWEAGAEEKKQFKHEFDAAREEKEMKEAQEEAAYIQQGEIKYQKRLFDKLSVDDEREFLARARGQYEEPKKPFAHIQRGNV